MWHLNCREKGLGAPFNICWCLMLLSPDTSPGGSHGYWKERNVHACQSWISSLHPLAPWEAQVQGFHLGLMVRKQDHSLADSFMQNYGKLIPIQLHGFQMFSSIGLPTFEIFMSDWAGKEIFCTFHDERVPM